MVAYSGNTKTRAKKSPGPVRLITNAVTAGMDRDLARLVRKGAKGASRAAGQAFQQHGQAAPHRSSNQPGMSSMASAGGSFGAGKYATDNFISRKETLALDVNTSIEGFHVLYNKVLTPVDPLLFPAQNYFAQAHGEFKFRKMQVTFKSTVSQYTSPNGRLWFVWLPDATATVPITMADVQSVAHKCSGRGYENLTLEIRPSDWLKTGSHSDGGQAPNNLAHGRLMVITDLTPGTTPMGKLGDLDVISAIEFKDFRTPASVAPVAAAPSFFKQTNAGAVAPRASAASGTVTYPTSADGSGTMSISRSGAFHNAEAAYYGNGTTGRYFVYFDTTGLEPGTVICITRFMGQSKQASNYVTSSDWSTDPGGGGTTAMLNAQWEDEGGSDSTVVPYRFSIFGKTGTPDPYANNATTAMPVGADNALGKTAVVGTQVATNVSWAVVVGAGLNAISFDAVAMSYWDQAPSNWGWITSMSIVGFDPIIAQAAILKRSTPAVADLSPLRAALLARGVGIESLDRTPALVEPPCDRYEGAQTTQSGPSTPRPTPPDSPDLPPVPAMRLTASRSAWELA